MCAHMYRCMHATWLYVGSETGINQGGVFAALAFR